MDAEEEAHERARRRLEERRARMRGEAPGAGGVPKSPTGGHHPRQEQVLHSLFDLANSAVMLLRKIGLKRIAIALAAVALVVVLIVGIRSCTTSGASGATATGAAATPDEQQVQRDPIDQAALSSILGEELSAQLVEAAKTSDDIAWIAAHPDAYAVDGEAVQYKLLKLATTEPDAVAFVRAFPDTYPANSAQATGDPPAAEVPHLYQWDTRWGSTVYSSTTFALTGCCPTALSMVYQGLTGKGDLSPYDMGKRASDGGYETQFDGTDAAFLVNEAASLGLSCDEVSLDVDSVKAALEGGAALICNVGPGDFTDSGHFFVITSIDGEGNLVINDPYSAVRSSKTWGVDTVLDQTKALWAYRSA